MGPERIWPAGHRRHHQLSLAHRGQPPIRPAGELRPDRRLLGRRELLRLVYAWGEGEQGELGNGKKAGTDVPVYVKLPKGTKVASVAVGSDQLFAITSAGGMLAWMSGSNGQLGDGHTGGVSRVPVRVHLPRGVKVVSASAGLLHGLAQTTTGKMLASGDDAFGQTGDGGVADKLKPTPIMVPANRVIAIGAGPEAYDSMAIVDELVA